MAAIAMTPDHGWKRLATAVRREHRERPLPSTPVSFTVRRGAKIQPCQQIPDIRHLPLTVPPSQHSACIELFGDSAQRRVPFRSDRLDNWGQILRKIVRVLRHRL
jgi:hypothetical protein